VRSTAERAAERISDIGDDGDNTDDHDGDSGSNGCDGVDYCGAGEGGRELVVEAVS